mgnify:CR=1 FL=1
MNDTLKRILIYVLVFVAIAIGVKVYTNKDATGKKAGDIGKTINNVKIVSWSTGTNAQIVAMVKAADAGKIKLSDYWNVGEKRKVKLSAMYPSCGLSDSHKKQTVELVLMNVGGRTLSNGKQCSFIVGQKDCLKEPGALNAVENYGEDDFEINHLWYRTDRRRWLNSTYRDAIPGSLRPIFKKFKVTTMTSIKPKYKSRYDYFTLPGRFEVPYDRHEKTWKLYVKEGSPIEYYNLSSEATNKFTGKKHINWWTRSCWMDSHTIENMPIEITMPANAFNGETSTKKLGICPYGVI